MNNTHTHTHTYIIHHTGQGRVFSGWNTVDPTFEPTFKVKRGEKETKYLHQRIPSWCDRILWTSRPHLKGYVKCDRFENIPSMHTSDHKPVRAMMSLKLERKPRRMSYFDEEGLSLLISNIKCGNLPSMDSDGMCSCQTHTYLSHTHKL